MSSSHYNVKRVYLHYYASIIILVEKLPQNDNIIVYRNNFWENLSSSQICYHDRPMHA